MSRRRRRPSGLVGVFVSALLAGCTTVRPPDAAKLADPCTVYLMRSMAHMALALPDERGELLRFGFGDRRFMTNFSWTQYPWGAVLLVGGLFGQPTATVVERVGVKGSTRDEIARESGMETLELQVDHALALALRHRLDRKCGPPLPDFPWLFETDDGYSLWWDNCQSAVVGWCRDLGCEISPWRVVPRWGRWQLEKD